MGEAVYVHRVALKVVDVERGWTPGEGCCVGAVPDVLLSGSGGNHLFGFKRGTEDYEFFTQPDWYSELDDIETEYVRVELEIESVVPVESRVTFDAGRVVLVDENRRVLARAFYPGLENRMNNRRGDLPLSLTASLLRQTPKPVSIYGGGNFGLEMAWLVPKDAEGLTLVYLPYDFDNGAFLALERAEPAPPFTDRAVPKWVDDAVPATMSSPSDPVPMGTGAKHENGVAVRILEVDRSPSPCIRFSTPIAGDGCLSVTVEFAIEPSEFRQNAFSSWGFGYTRVETAVENVVEVDLSGDDPTATFIVGRETPVEGGSKVDLRVEPQFESFLEWAEFDERGSAVARYKGEVDSDWSDGVASITSYGRGAKAFMSFGELAEGPLDGSSLLVDDEQNENTESTSLNAGSDIYEHLLENSPTKYAEVESLLGEFAVACAA